MSITLVSAALLIDTHHRIFIAKRPEGKSMAGLWEFPGGKVEPDETPECCLARELAEELSITVSLDDLDPLTFVSHPYDDFSLLMLLYTCRTWEGTLSSSEYQEFTWIDVSAVLDYAMPDANRPLQNFLINNRYIF